MMTSPRASKEREAVRRSGIIKEFALTERVIYRGLASTIFLGIRKDNGLEVAVKVLSKESFDSQEERQRAEAEVSIHASIPQHVNVVPLLLAEETESAILLVIPFMPSGDLWDLIKYGQTFCETEARNCIAQMLAALHHIHSACNLVHGDIKPHNFLLNKIGGKYAVQLCDFGLAQRPESNGRISFAGLRGTHGWFPPELLEQQDYGFAADLFGIGLILFRMLGGYPPFDPPSNFRSAVEFDARYWCHVSLSCRQFIEKLLAFDPDVRGSAYECMQDPWFSSLHLEEPSPAVLAHLSQYSPPPSTDVCFWPPNEVPAGDRRNSYSDLTLLAEHDADDEFGLDMVDV